VPQPTKRELNKNILDELRILSSHLEKITKLEATTKKNEEQSYQKR
jgi:hypothetical protein